MTTVLTHSGSFHADDVFAYAVLRAAFGTVDLVRSRAPEAAMRAQIVFDVGGVYDPASGRYDHHMRDRPLRADGTPYSSVGLIWRDFGRSALPRLLEAGPLDAELADLVWREIDSGLIMAIDRADNGIATAGPGHVSAVIEALNPGWDEPKNYDERFQEAAGLALGILARACRQALAAGRAIRLVVEAAARSQDPRVVVLDRKLPWEKAVFEAGLDRALYIVQPNDEGTTWYCTAVPVEPGSFEQRFPLPEEWRGLSDEAFSAAAGIPDGVFCHPSRFTCGARSRASAIELARQASDRRGSVSP